MSTPWYLFLIGAVGGCHENRHPAPNLAGDYSATEVRLTRSGRDVDLLAEGARLSIRLQPTSGKQGTTSGSLMVPAGYTESRMAETHSLLGRYLYDPAAGTVAFEHDSDSFLPYLSWQVDGTIMRAAFSAGGDRLEVTLERAD